MDDRQRFEQRLRRFSAVRRHLLNAALGYRLGSWAALLGVVCLPLSSGWLANPFATALLSLLLLVALLSLLVVGWRRRVRFRSCLHEAFEVEALAGDLNSRLISAWDFLQRGLTAPLARVVIGRAAADLDGDFEAKLDGQARDRRRRHFVFSLLLLLLLAANPWAGLRRSVAHVRESWFAVFEHFFPVRYELTPEAPVTIARIGDTVEVGLRFLSRGYRTVELMVEQGEQSRRQQLTTDGERRASSSLSSAVEAEYALSFAFGGRRLPARQIIFTAQPELLNMQAELIYPAYTRMVPRQLEGIQTRLAALPGTRVTLGFTFSKPLASAQFVWDDGETLPLEVVGRFASVSLMHSRERRATVVVVDQHGLTPDPAPILAFALQRDEPPRLFVPGHLGEEMPMAEEAVELFGFGIRGEDDFGITRCVLTWRRGTVDNPTRVLQQGEIERLISPSQRRVVTAFEQIFAGVALSPGDRVTIELAVYDNRSPEAQVTRGRPISFFVHQADLGGLSLADLGFGGGLRAQPGRIPRARRSTTVKEPDSLRTVEQLRLDWSAPIEAPVVAPTVRGEHGQAARDYFHLLSELEFEREKGEGRR